MTQRMRSHSQCLLEKGNRGLFQRLIYFVVMIVTGGSAGLGGWALKDHPTIQALIGMVTGKAEQFGGRWYGLREQVDFSRRGRDP